MESIRQSGYIWHLTVADEMMAWFLPNVCFSVDSSEHKAFILESADCCLCCCSLSGQTERKCMIWFLCPPKLSPWASGDCLETLLSLSSCQPSWVWRLIETNNLLQSFFPPSLIAKLLWKQFTEIFWISQPTECKKLSAEDQAAWTCWEGNVFLLAGSRF